MNHINDNIDDLFRKRLGNKEMKLGNPYFEVDNLNSPKDWISKSLKVIQSYKVLLAVAAIGAFGTIYFLLSNREIDKNVSDISGIDAVTLKDSIVVTPHETPVLTDDKPVEEAHFLKQKKEKVISGSKKINSPHNVKKEVLNNKSGKEPEPQDRNSENVAPIEQPGSLKQLVPDSIADNNFIEDSVITVNKNKQIDKQPDEQPKTDIQFTESTTVIDDSIKSNTEEIQREKKKRKRQVKKLR
jgi:hypothetical protein